VKNKVISVLLTLVLLVGFSIIAVVPVAADSPTNTTSQTTVTITTTTGSPLTVTTTIPTTYTTTSIVPATSSNNTGLILGIVGGLLVIALIVLFVVRSQKARRS